MVYNTQNYLIFRELLSAWFEHMLHDTEFAVALRLPVFLVSPRPNRQRAVENSPLYADPCQIHLCYSVKTVSKPSHLTNLRSNCYLHSSPFASITCRWEVIYNWAV
jgi:hypothetical protein